MKVVGVVLVPGGVCMSQFRENMCSMKLVLVLGSRWMTGSNCMDGTEGNIDIINYPHHQVIAQHFHLRK